MKHCLLGFFVPLLALAQSAPSISGVNAVTAGQNKDLVLSGGTVDAPRVSVGVFQPTGGGEVDSMLTIAGSIGNGLTGDFRALGIRTTLYPTGGGGRSSEGINNSFRVVLPAVGDVASVEAYHFDPDRNGGLWNDNNGTPWPKGKVGFVAGLRIRGRPIPSGANEVFGIKIDSGLTNSSPGGTAFNIMSQGNTARNFFEGSIEVYGNRMAHVIGTKTPIGVPSSSGGMVPDLNPIGVLIGPDARGDGGTYGTRAVQVSGMASPAAGRNGYGLFLVSEIGLAASGTHPDFVGVQIDAPVVSGLGGIVNNATTLKVGGAPSAGALLNRALWVVSGATHLGGTLTVAGASTFQTVTSSGAIVAGSSFSPSASAVTWRAGSGTPEGVVTAAIGSIYSRTDGGAGTSFYVKESGTGNTGWVPK